MFFRYLTSKFGGYVLLSAALLTQPESCEQINLLHDAGYLSDSEYQELNGETIASRDMLESEIAPEPCSRLLDGPPRGVACLHCTQEEAREQAELLLDTLYQSCIKNLATNFLVDSTFSYDEEFLLEQIEKLTLGGRKLWVTFYALNGSTQRRWNQTSIRALGTDTSPRVFRQRLLYDPVLQEQVKANIIRLVPVIKYALSRGSAVSLTLSLEDNLTDEAFSKLLDLALEALPPALSISILRNPCPGCYAGNEQGIPEGVQKEIHTISAYFSNRDGLVSNDGESYSFEDEVLEAEEPGLSLDALAGVRDRAGDLNNVFILWNGKYQGLEDGGGSFPHPRDRNYVLPSPDERSELIHFLREGLE